MTRPFFAAGALENLPPALRGGMVAIGNFDGFHRGHQSILSELRREADAAGVPALVLTFEPHPRDVFAPAPFLFRLTPEPAKMRLAEALGLDGIVVLPFTREFSQIEAEDFVADILVGALDVRGVVIGEDFHFGRQRRGTPAFLATAGERHGFSVTARGLIDERDEVISSSRIRAALGEGDIGAANRLLGYHWFFSGTVVDGDKRGRELGYPTANIAAPPGFALAQGVYAVRAELDGRLIDGVAGHGKPMFDNHRPPFETHLFDFDADIYGRTLTVAVVDFLRGQEVFDGLDALVAAMDRDSRNARAALARMRALSPLDVRLGFAGS